MRKFKNYSDKTRTFLATSALDTFWDKTKPILFLGDWCTRYDNMSAWEEIDGEVLDSPLHDQHPDKVLVYIETTYLRILPLVANWLNEIHHADHPVKYWEIIIGSFLFIHIKIIYDRYQRIKKAYDLFPTLNTIGLAQNSFITPLTMSEYYMFSIQSDLWNLQLCTQIIKSHFNASLSYKEYEDKYLIEQRNSLVNTPDTDYKWTTQLKINFTWWMIKLRGKKITALVQYDFSKKNLIKLMFRSRFKIMSVPVKEKAVDIMNGLHRIPDLKLRSKITAIPAKEAFTKLVLELLAVNMPMSFVENYQSYCKISKKQYPYFAKMVVGSPVSSGEALKIWQAKNSHKGMKRIGLQHGGGYGALQSISDEYVEHKFADFYITWGKLKKENKVIGLPSVPVCEHLENHKHSSQIREISILWVTTEFTRYPVPEIKLALGSGFYEKIYYGWQFDILKQLDPSILSKITMRLRFSDFSDQWKSIKEAFPLLQLDKPKDKSSFYIQIEKAKLLLFDNFNTTYLYGFARNIPSILFFDERIWSIRNEVRSYFDALKKAGIFHTSVESVTKMINQVGDNPLLWWNGQEVQQARMQYCDYFLDHTPNWLKKWNTVLLGLVKNNKDLNDGIK